MHMDMWKLSAVEVVALLKSGQVTPQELIEVVEARWQAVDPAINATPTPCFERARAAAKALKHPTDPGPGYLYGLPIVVKDSTPVKGVLWTSGSKLFETRIAHEDDPHVENLERNGAIIVGKTNLPEFGAGANTYNIIFGETRNPWDLQKTSGGSSGGTAAALAAGEVWLGTGGDLGGSLRIPASFCGVVGFRSSVGLVPQSYAGPQPISIISGPMARNVPDLALMLDAMVGQHPRDPLSLPRPSQSFQAAIEEGSQPDFKRIAWSADLAGISPTDAEVAGICKSAAYWFESQGATVTEACPDLSDADETFQVLRADGYSKAFRHIQADEELGQLLKPELHWQILKGVKQTTQQMEAAYSALRALQQRVKEFFQDFELLCTPCVMTPPFDVSTRWPTRVGGREFSNYVEWLLMTFAFSMVDVPVISVPCGVTTAGLPVGLQIVGRYRSDARVLYAAGQYERHHEWHKRVPLSAIE